MCIVFQVVILQNARHVTSSSVIRRIIYRCLDACEAGEFEILAEDTARTCIQYLSTSRAEDTKEHWDNIFQSLMLRGNSRSDFQWITNKDKGRVLQPGDI